MNHDMTFDCNYPPLALVGNAGTGANVGAKVGAKVGTKVGAKVGAEVVGAVFTHTNPRVLSQGFVA